MGAREAVRAADAMLPGTPDGERVVGRCAASLIGQRAPMPISDAADDLPSSAATRTSRTDSKRWLTAG